MNNWLNSITDEKLHHIGEYYSLKYNKPFQKKNSYKTAAYKRWWLNQNSNAIADAVMRNGFKILRDWDTYGFFIQKVE
jgi:hypothetical protein